MSRINLIDQLRGASFFPMFIFHLFASYDLVNLFTVQTVGNKFIQFLGLIRNVFIVLAGISMSLSVINKTDPTKYYMNRLKRSIKILIHAMFLTALTHYLFPGFGIKFGVLHFIAIATLILSPIADNNILLLFVLIAALFIEIPPINSVIDTISGAKIHYNMADWFPLNKYLPLLIGGIFLGKIIFNDYEKETPKELSDTSILEWMGQNSLELYTGHFSLLMIIMYIAKHYFKLF
jgi:uncharacterized membrane protein